MNISKWGRMKNQAFCVDKASVILTNAAFMALIIESAHLNCVVKLPLIGIYRGRMLCRVHGIEL